MSPIPYICSTAGLWNCICIILCLLLPNITLGQRAEWREIARSENTTFRAMDCLDRQNCVAVGHHYGNRTMMLLTSDGGVTWRDITIDGYTAVPLHFGGYPSEVSYPAPGVIVVAGDSGIIWSTHDGGATFQRYQTDDTTRATNLEMKDARRGIVMYDNGAFVTSDGWKTSRRISLPDSLEPYAGLTIALSQQEDVAYISIYHWIKRKAYFLVLNLQGDLLEVRSAPPFGKDLVLTADGLMASTGAKFIDSTNGLTSRMIVSTSRNLGVDWQIRLDTLPWQLAGASTIHFSDNGLGVVGGFPFLIWSTTDTGASWMADTVMITGGSELGMTDVRCFNDGTCIASMQRNSLMQRYVPTAHASEVSTPTMDYTIRVMPNPARARFTVAIDGVLPATATVEIFNMMGQKQSLDIEPMHGSASSRWSVNSQELSTGLYVVRISNAGTISTSVTTVLLR